MLYWAQRLIVFIAFLFFEHFIDVVYCIITILLLFLILLLHLQEGKFSINVRGKKLQVSCQRNTLMGLNII